MRESIGQRKTKARGTDTVHRTCSYPPLPLRLRSRVISHSSKMAACSSLLCLCTKDNFSYLFPSLPHPWVGKSSVSASNRCKEFCAQTYVRSHSLAHCESQTTDGATTIRGRTGEIGNSPALCKCLKLGYTRETRIHA